MKRISLTGFKPDDRDTLDILARQLSTEHANVQIALLRFSLAADTGGPVSDGAYMQILAALTRLNMVSSQVRVAVLSYRTTSRLPTVQEGGSH